MDVDAGASPIEEGDNDQLMCKLIEKKIEIAELKLKKRVLLEELYRQFFEGEKEPKKRKRREVKQEENATNDTEGTELIHNCNVVAKRRRSRGPVVAAVAASQESDA